MPGFLAKTQARVEGEGTRRVAGAGGSERAKVRKVAPIEARVSDCALHLTEIREEWNPERLALVDGFVGSDLAARGWMRIDATNGRFECRPQPPGAGDGPKP
jgi:hypothetical protein